MDPIYLINKETIQVYEDLSKNVSEDKVKKRIKLAQDLDISPFLGGALFYALVKQFNPDGTMKDDAPQHYKDLFNGAEYTDRSGNPVYFEGLKMALVYFAYARYLEKDSLEHTMTGTVKKHHDNADAISVADNIKLVQQQRSVANAYTNKVESFLNANLKNFPLWRSNSQNKSARQSGPRIRGIDKTKFNNPGRTNNQGYPNDWIY